MAALVVGRVDSSVVPSEGAATQMLALLKVCTTTGLVVALLLGPGLVLRARFCRVKSLGALPLPGMLSLASVGLLSWWGAQQVVPRLSSTLMTFACLAACAWALRHCDLRQILGREQRAALCIVGLVLVIAVGRSVWSVGPAGELYGASISRTLEVGDRSDSRISFHVVQLVANGLSPYGDIGRVNFLPYNFSDRGPLAGLVSAPVVLATGGRPSVRHPDQPWQVFDPYGFMAYRIAMVALASWAFVALWSILRRVAGVRAAQLGLLVAATTPFLVHETWFTWPKMLTAALVLLSVELLLSRRAMASGLLVGLGYLAHPMALLSVPALVLLGLPQLGLTGTKSFSSWCRQAALISAGVVIFVLGWRLINGSEYRQSGFLDYLTAAHRVHPVTLGAWVSHRLESLGNTLVPLRVVLFSSGDPSLNAIDPATGVSVASSGIVHLNFAYWATLPFGIGLTGIPVFAGALRGPLARHLCTALITLGVPLLAFWVFWGNASTGLLREGLHVWVLTLVAFCGMGLVARRGLAFRSTTWFAVLRGVELYFVVLAPSVLTQGKLVGDVVISDVSAVVVILLSVGALCLLLRRELQEPQRRR